MAARRLPAVALLALLVVFAGCTGAVTNVANDGEYDRTTVTVVDEDGAELGAVDARVADTYSKRYTGLSDTESLGENEGMLFVHDEEDRYAYVMREMSFPIDIVFIAANGTITRIHHAELPPEGTNDSELRRYRGTGKYVLEVPHGWTNDHDVCEGDTVEIAGDY
ncbi:DUF192 domain-containing protein [Halobaculum magnesiiphilum]|uniref:DUF192 domain-containing protein n=1 Tax=Halobaculum magnesiiphilum TaxID=1017351 RepID=A0A8T8WC02_9EURY|nr:DUF192 domain-containing protein [Halobaculum magnesiiphilum]QZP37283.1 DUF192 domain-containing protein [Halobaculum magnesiiphilum]